MEHETLFMIVSFCISFMITLGVVTLCMFFISRDLRVRAICATLLVILTLNYVFFAVLYYQIHVFLGILFERMKNVTHSDIHDGIFRTLRIHTDDCRVKLVCELSKISIAGNKQVASIIQLLAAFGGYGGHYMSGFLGGLSEADCAALYTTCEHSPLERTFPFLLDEL